MDPWYRIVTPRKEVREGRSFNPDEFAIALDQVVDGKAPADYQDPEQFFSRTYFTQSLTEHTGTVLKRLSGQTESAAPVLSLITQFGGGKTHTLTSLYHIARAGKGASNLTGVQDLLKKTGATVPDEVRVATFVGTAWDPSDGTETPWIDMARQIAGEEGVNALGATARTAPPGTRVLGSLFAVAEAPVLILFDEVLNFINRHGNMADHFYHVSEIRGDTAWLPKEGDKLDFDIGVKGKGLAALNAKSRAGHPPTSDFKIQQCTP